MNIPNGVVPFTTTSFLWNTTGLNGNFKVRVLEGGDPNSAQGVSNDFVIDNAFPVVSAGPDKTTKVLFTQTGTVNDPAPSSDIASIQWAKVSGPSTGNITFGSSIAAITTISADTDGTYYISLTAVDNAGNTSTDTMQLIWDTTAPIPTYTLNGLVQNAYFNPHAVSNNTIAIAITANEPVKFDRVYICLNGDDVCSNTTNIRHYFQLLPLSASYVGSWNGKKAGDVDFVADGLYKIKVHIEDEAGNDTTLVLSPYLMVVDTVNPTVSVPTSPVAETVYRTDPALTFTATDPVPGTDISCTYKIDTLTPVSVLCTGGNLTGLTDGRHSVVVTATDVAGNSKSSDPILFVYDNDNTLTVGANAADFTTIQAAVNAAVSGITKINVFPGPYAEIVHIAMPNLVIEGANADVSAVTGTRTAESILDGRFDLYANSITINGFKLLNGSAVGGVDKSVVYMVANTTGHTVSNNIVTGANESGTRGILFGYTVSNVTVSNNDVSGWNSGIYINPSATLIFSLNKFHGNVVGIGSDGISNVQVNGNVFDGNTVEGWGASAVGINVTGRNNKFINTPVSDKAVAQYSGNAIDAIQNWWGTAYKPTIQSRVSGSVTFESYYVDEAMTTLSNVPVSTVYVDDDYIDGSAGGHIFGYNAFSKIQDGINKVQASGTVNVAAGTYDESIDITKPLTILGHGQADTFLDRSTNATAGDVVDIHNLSGDVRVDGFTVKTGPASSVASNGIHIYSLTGPGTITISNNTIWGVQSAIQTAKDNYGLIAGYFTATTPKLVFDHNTVRGGSDNPILIEKWMGPTEITNNTLYQNPLKDLSSSDVIFMMNHDGSHNNAKQLISCNTIDMGWGTVYTYDTRGTGITVAGSFTGNTSLGGFTNVEIKNNILLNLKPFRRGIGLWNNSSNGTSGEITNAVISGNTISNATGYTGEFGIRDLGKNTGTQITNNLISGVIDAVKFQAYAGGSPSGAVVHNNSLVATTYGINNTITNLVDGINNWWGNATGPYHSPENTLGAGNAVSDNVDYSPWCTDVPSGDPLSCPLGSSDPLARYDITTSSPTSVVSTPITLTITAKDSAGVTRVNDTSSVTMSADHGASLGALVVAIADGGADGSNTVTVNNSVTGTVNVAAVQVGGTKTGATQVEFTRSDTVAPVISGQTPADGAINVPVSVVPTITFSKSLNSTTVSSATVQLKKKMDGTLIGATVALVEGGKKVTITPDSTLENNTQYYLAVTTGVTDLSGNPLASVWDTSATPFTTVAMQPIVVDEIVVQSNTATPTDSYLNGWHYTFRITVNDGLTHLRILFTDWVNSANHTASVSANGNMQLLFNTSTGNGLGSIVGLTDADIIAGVGPIKSYEIGNNYADQKLLIGGVLTPTAININTLDISTDPGQQIKFDVFTKLPITTAAGFYETTYGIQTE